ncbi:MAG TPA: DUF2497 domain-containing protein [Hyphomicrobium sp.]|nr:DUF2497 domain-containing protein [Hyphomicrobium sp.]
MSKPQLAAEPSMEEILASIRKLISDDKPGPSPTPDPFLSRTQSGSPGRPSVQGTNGFSAPAHEAKPAGSAPFNSLADALKVATTLSDQRRSLQHDVINALDRSGHSESHNGFTGSPNSRLDNVHRLSEAAGTQPGVDTGGLRLPSFPEWRSGPASAEVSGDSRDLLSFDFGTVIPKHEPLTVKSPAEAIEARLEVDKAGTDTARGQGAADASPANASALGAAARRNATGAAASTPVLATVESRVFSIPARVPLTVRAETSSNGAHTDTSLNGSAAKGAPLNGMPQDVVASLTVNGNTIAPFPRPLREALKSVEQAVALPPLSRSAENIVELQPMAKEAAADKPAADAVARGDSVSSTPLPKAEMGGASGESGSAKAEPSVASGAASARADALLDAVVDLVQQQPGALSVFASGSSFISGVGAKKLLEEAASATAAVSATQTGAPPKLDRAAAELLRPMLRQWLADNMPRIVEEALRSELTEQTEGANPSPGKA